jgi:ribosomal protein L11 methyltransferase
MGEHYFELQVKVDKFREEVESFLLDQIYTGIEERDGWLILRGEESFDPLIPKLKEYVSALEELFQTPIQLEIHQEKKRNRDWIEEYRHSVTPIEVGDFYIRPSWEESRPNKMEIVIDPALAFGSGHHDTTRGCLTFIQKVVKPGVSFLDVGTGSGILAIGAGKLGARVSACDTDWQAVQSAKKNAKLNGVEFNELWQGSVIGLTHCYEIVTANITADVLLFLASDLKRVARDYLILSGIIEKYRDKILKKYRELELVDEINSNGWVTLLLKGKDEKK